MTRLTIVIIAVALLGVATLSVAHAQEPTGSISGRIVFKGDHHGLLELLLVSADTPQPIDDQILINYDLLVDVDGQGNFSISGLADGDYFLVLLPSLTPAEPLPEGVDFVDTFGEIHTLPALRVTVAGGEAVTGVEIPIMRLDATPTPLPPPGLPGSISGHIVSEDFPGARFYDISVVSADVPQPIPIGLLQNFGVDDQNNFVVTGLEGGDYFLLVDMLFEPIEPAPEEVLLLLPPEAVPKTFGPLSAPAVRVTVPDGGAVTGLEIIVTRVDTVFGPTTGAGPGGADDATGRIAAGLAVVAALLLAGGVAVWARSRRLL